MQWAADTRAQRCVFSRAVTATGAQVCRAKSQLLPWQEFWGWMEVFTHRSLANLSNHIFLNSCCSMSDSAFRCCPSRSGLVAPSFPVPSVPAVAVGWMGLVLTWLQGSCYRCQPSSALCCFPISAGAIMCSTQLQQHF